MQQAGLRSSLGRSTFHRINMNLRPDRMKAPAEPDGAPQPRRPLSVGRIAASLCSASSMKASTCCTS
jgi:hypothetical protein